MKGRDKNGGFVKGALIIAGGGFVAKLIGALYRIPLTNCIGGHGMGLYQMIYPVYCMLLTVSATGIPSALSKLTAERIARGESSKPLFILALRLFLLIGGAGTLLMCALAPVLAKAQGVSEVTAGYLTLAPSVVLVSAISVFRGWFQGKNDMTPTAICEIVEQGVKVAVGLLFAYYNRGNVVRAVTLLLLAVSVSECVALLLLWILYRRADKADGETLGEKPRVRGILSLSVPVTFGAILFPVSAFIDSILSVRLLSGYVEDAVGVYGLFSGGAVTVINLPVSVCYGIAVASVPALAKAKTDYAVWRALPDAERAQTPKPSPKRRLWFALGLTLFLAILGGAGVYLFAKPVCGWVFRSLQPDELDTLIALIKTLAVSAVTLSCVQTLSACLTAQGKPQYSALAMLVGITVKTVVYTLLLQNPTVGIFGLAHATNIGYTVAFFLDLWYNIRCIKTNEG